MQIDFCGEKWEEGLIPLLHVSADKWVRFVDENFKGHQAAIKELKDLNNNNVCAHIEYGHCAPWRKVNILDIIKELKDEDKDRPNSDDSFRSFYCPPKENPNAFRQNAEASIQALTERVDLSEANFQNITEAFKNSTRETDILKTQLASITGIMSTFASKNETAVIFQSVQILLSTYSTKDEVTRMVKDITTSTDFYTKLEQIVKDSPTFGDFQQAFNTKLGKLSEEMKDCIKNSNLTSLIKELNDTFISRFEHTINVEEITAFVLQATTKKEE